MGPGPGKETRSDPEIYRVGDLVVDVAGATVFREEERVALEPRTFDLLVALVRHHPGIARRADLRQSVWPGECVTDQVLSHRVMVLRRALGDHADAPVYVAGERGWGYRLVGPVEPLAPAKTTSTTGPRRRPGPVMAVGGVIAAVAASFGLAWLAQGNVPRGVPSVVVGPIRAEEVPPALRVVGTDIDDALRARLRRQDGLRVVSGPDGDRARLQVEGRLSGTDQKLTLVWQVIDNPTGRVLWSRTFEGSFYRLRARQDSMVSAAAQVVLDELVPSRPARAGPESVSPRVRRLCLRAELDWLSWSDEGLRRAKESWVQATTLSPRHAPAWAGRALTEVVRGFLGYRAPAEAGAEARRLARHALALDDTLPHGHLAFGLVRLLYDRDIEGAAREVNRAAEMEPGELPVALGQALLLQAEGRPEESLSRLTTATDESFPCAAALLLSARAHTMGRRWNDAAGAYEGALALEPHLAVAYRELAECHTFMGRTTDGLGALRQEASLAGRGTDTPSTLEQAWKRLCLIGGPTPRETARACVLAGDRERARAALASGIDGRWPSAAFVDTDPILAEVGRAAGWAARLRASRVPID